MEKMVLKKLKGEFQLIRLNPDSAIPSWIFNQELFSVSRTPDEISILVSSQNCGEIPEPHKVEGGWSCLKVEGVLDFSLTGILASIANPLAENKISLFALSTYDTDYILVKKKDLQAAERVLRNNHFDVI